MSDTTSGDTAGEEEYVIHTEGLSKHYGNIQAVDGVDVSVPDGEIMALVGDNGAGKTTLIQMLCGVRRPTAGRIYVRGEPVSFENYNDARQHGIETVYQDLALAESQTVAANVFLGNEPIQEGRLARWLGLVDTEHMETAAREALDRVNIPVDPNAKVADLSGGQQQAVAIARALQFDPEILILDEPTSALSIDGARNVLRVLANLRKRGLSMVLISHNIQEVLAIADRITVLSQGKVMGVRASEGTDREEIVSLMMGAQDETELETLQQVVEGSAA